MEELKLLTEKEVKALSFDDQKEYFLNLSRKIIHRLSEEEKAFFSENVKKLKTLPQRIKFLQSFHEVALRNETVDRLFDFIKRYFPEDYEDIRADYESDDATEAFYALILKHGELTEALIPRLEMKILELKIILKDHLNEEEYDLILEELKKREKKKVKKDKLISIHDYLKSEVDRRKLTEKV